MTWLAAEALGNVTDHEKARKAFDILILTSSIAPPAGTSDDAPQLRYYALDSAAKLARLHSFDIKSIEALLGKVDEIHNEKVREAIKSAARP